MLGAFHLAATAGDDERLDGRGYHLGLRADQLNREARILAVADVLEALSADRPLSPRRDDPQQVRSITRGERYRLCCRRWAR